MSGLMSESCGGTGVPRTRYRPTGRRQAADPTREASPQLPEAFRHGGLIKVAQNREWLSIATRQISRYWQSRNEKKRTSSPGGAIDGKTSS